VRSCSLRAGHGMAGEPTCSWIHLLVFATMLSITVYVIIDLEYPGSGLIRIDGFDQALLDVRASMQ
jgi:hypothetical protein